MKRKKYALLKFNGRYYLSEILEVKEIKEYSEDLVIVRKTPAMKTDRLHSYVSDSNKHGFSPSYVKRTYFEDILKKSEIDIEKFSTGIESKDKETSKLFREMLNNLYNENKKTL